MSENASVEVVQPVTLQDSFDLVLDRIRKVKQNMADSDRQVYQAVGKFVNAATATAQAATDVLQDLQGEPDPTTSVQNDAAQMNPHAPADSLIQQLQLRQEQVRYEADELLCTAVSSEDIDRLLQLEQLHDRIQARLQQLQFAASQRSPDVSSQAAMPPNSSLPASTPDLDTLTKKDLKAIAKSLGLKGYSKLSKADLVDQIRLARRKQL